MCQIINRGGKINTKAILFDLDGTLIDSFHIYHAAVNHILSFFDVRCTIDELMIHAGKPGEELYTYFLKKEGVYDHSMKEKLKKEFENKFLELLQNTSFPKESAEVIIELKNEGYILALCTGASRSFTQAMLPENISLLFSSIVTCDDVLMYKPNPETFLKASDDIGIPPINCTVVGDGMNDRIGAENAGMKFVLINENFGLESFLLYCVPTIGQRHRRHSVLFRHKETEVKNA